MPPMTGRVIAGRYNLVETIGRGAMGVVWRARDSLLDRDVAIKEVVLSAAIGDEERENVYRRTMREARTAARLSHRGVVTVYDVAEEDGRPWIIMELVPSRSLDQLLSSDGPLPPRRACLIGRQLLAALAAAHAAGVLHRDVKPSNVLIADDPDGERAVLTDFGIAQFAGDPRLTQTGMVMGSPGFTAPERIRGGIATPASDLWSLGATLYAAVQGRGPYEERGGAITTMSAIINEDAPPASSAGPLGPLIAALLRRNPVARPTAASAARMFAGVLPLLPEVPRPARRAPTPTLASAAVPASSPAGATSQDAVPDPGKESDGAAPKAALEDAPPAASTAEDAAPAADEQPVGGQAAGDELAGDQMAGDQMAGDQADADDDAAAAEDAVAAENDGADDYTGGGTGSADDETSADQLAGAEPAETESDGTESDGTESGDAEPVGTEAADAEATGEEKAGDEKAEDEAASVDGAAADEAPRAAEVAAADAPGAEDRGPAAADEAAALAQAQPAGEPGPAGKAGTADKAGTANRAAAAGEAEPVRHAAAAGEADPVRHAAAASEAVPRQATPMGSAGVETPLLTPSWSWPETDGARDAAWSVRDNWGDPPTMPEPSFAPPPLPRPRPRRGRRTALAAAAVVLAAAIGTAVALLTRHTPAARGSTGGSSTTAVSSLPESVKAINNSAAGLPPGWTTETVSPGAHGTAGGFSIGVPPGWIERQRALATYLDAPGADAAAGFHYMQVDLTRHDLPNMLAEAEYVERNAIAQGHLPGYHRVSLRQVTIRGTAGAYWAFTWVTPSGVTMRVDDLLFELNTSSGPQSYAVYLTSSATEFSSGGLALFDRMLRTFAPITG